MSVQIVKRLEVTAKPTLQALIEALVEIPNEVPHEAEIVDIDLGFDMQQIMEETPADDSSEEVITLILEWPA